jgi:SPP1 gp7 family putative phage head morphogenesis protein
MSLAKDITHIVSFKLPPKDAIKYLEHKGYKLTFDYKEMMHEAHHKAFTVAKITRLDLLSDIKEAILNARKQGLSYQSFKKQLEPILIKKGWWADVEIKDPKTGQTKKIFVGNRRLKTIFYTNARVSYQVAKAKKYYTDKNVKYLKYIAVLDSKTRPSHKALNGIVLDKNDPFWQTHYPPNGWNCRCRVRAIPAHKKITPADKTNLPKNAVEPDWAYDVREGRFFDKFSSKDVELKATANYKDFNLPSASEFKVFDNAPKILPKKEAINILKKTLLNGKEKNIIKTPITEVLIDEQMIKHIIKYNKEKLAFFLPTLTNPDEIWAVKEKSGSVIKKRYKFIKFFKTKKDNIITILRLLRDGSFDLTIFKSKNLKSFDKHRAGILMYFKKDKNGL